MPKYYHSSSALELISIYESTQLEKKKKKRTGLILIRLSFSINFIATLPKEKFTLEGISFERVYTFFFPKESFEKYRIQAKQDRLA